MSDYRGHLTSMSGMDAYNIYQTVKLHFTQPKFDMFRTPSIRRISLDKYHARQDFGVFDSWARTISDRQRWGMLLVANFAYGNPDVVYGSKAQAFKLESQWQMRQASLRYVIDTDCRKLQPRSLSELLQFESSRIPELFREYIGSNITLETMVAFNHRLNLIKTWTQERSMMNSLLQPEFMRVTKVSRFINVNTPPINNRLNEFLEKETARRSYVVT